MSAGEGQESGAESTIGCMVQALIYIYFGIAQLYGLLIWLAMLLEVMETGNGFFLVFTVGVVIAEIQGLFWPFFLCFG